MWNIDNSNSIHDSISSINNKFRAKDADTFDFSTLFTEIEHHDLKIKMADIIRPAFRLSRRKYLTFYNWGAKWTKDKSTSHLFTDCKQFIDAIHWLIDNIYVTFGDAIFRHTIGIPMGTDCAPFLANIFLFGCEHDWILKMKEQKRWKLLLNVKHFSRYIDDLFCINNHNLLYKHKHAIHPVELELNHENKNNKTVDYLDLNLTIKNKKITTKIYDKRDNFNFAIINLPDISGNIPPNQTYGVFATELVRYARGTTYIKQFKHRVLRLVGKLRKQGFRKRRLCHVFRTFCDRHMFLLLKYGMRVLSMYTTF